MSVEQLITAHLDIWTAADTEKKSGRGRSSGSAGSVYGVKKLRELILELAVRGKLVPQDESDEPASELLKRIAAEKAKLIAESKIKKSKPLSLITDKEKPFELPKRWEWIRFGDALLSRDADRIPVSSDERQFRKGEYDYYGASGVIDKIDKYLFDKPLLLIGEDGANLINRSTPIAFIARGKYWVNNHAHVLDGISEDFLRYIELYINAIDLKPYVTGTAQPKMNQSKMNDIVLGLPPEAEQHRIVAKVDELMALCDQLENQHNNAAEAHDKLVTHLLGTLTQSQNAEDFNTHWQRISEHFDTLFTTEASIDALKQTLLQLAVMGKLVPQDPNDEPASELLKRIQAKKATLIAEGKIKKDKPLAEITDEEKPFDLPAGWEWARLGSIGFSSTGRTPSTQNSSLYDGTIPFMGPGQITLACTLLPAEKWLSEAGRNETTIAKAGDILMVCIGGSIGKSAIADKEMGFNQQINCISPVYAESKFAHISMMANSFQSKLLEFATGSATPIINKSKWEELLVPLSPLIEQYRIIAKVDELMPICDQLKAQINSASQLQKKLADIMVEQAIS